MPADPISAGRKGGQSKSPAKLAAARRNGFQKPAPAPAPVEMMGKPPACVLISDKPKEGK
jgi:hypothetical protein